MAFGISDQAMEQPISNINAGGSHTLCHPYCGSVEIRTRDQEVTA